jgi:hypothetical protein
MINALFAFGRDSLNEDWMLIPLPDASAIAKWLFLASTPITEDPLMTPRTKNIGTSNLLVLSFLLLRVYAKGQVLHLSKSLQIVLSTIFSNIDSLLGVESRYAVAEEIVTATGKLEDQSEDDVDGLVERVEKALSSLELTIEETSELETLKIQLEAKEREIKFLKQQLLDGEKENRELNKSLEQIRKFEWKTNDIQTNEIVLNDWFDKSTVDSAVMTCKVISNEAGVECIGQV